MIEMGNCSTKNKEYIQTKNLSYTATDTPAIQEEPKDEETCAICLSNMKISEYKTTYCNHLFHPDCLNTWLEHHITCPICRHNIGSTPPKSETIETIHTLLNSREIINFFNTNLDIEVQPSLPIWQQITTIIENQSIIENQFIIENQPFI